MAAILRVKRRNDDEPLDALLVSTKRQKTSDNADASESRPVATVAQFAGTVKNQDEDILEHINKTISNKHKESYKKHVVDILTKTREAVKKKSAESRYKVVNCVRSLDPSGADSKPVTVIDIEDFVSCSAVKESEDKEDASYVYDLYYAPASTDMHMDERMSIHALDQEFAFEMYRDPENPSENEYESEDSNSESNWKNDYPDSDYSKQSDDDIDECMRNALTMGSDYDLSSDEDFVNAVDEEDVERHGFSYARYKAWVKKQLDEENSFTEEEQNNV